MVEASLAFWAAAVALGFWFWALTLLGLVFLIAETVHEKHVLAVVTLIAYFAALHFWLQIRPWTFIKEHPWYIVAAAVGYFVIGTIFIFAKWRAYIAEQNRRADDAVHSWKKNKGIEGKIPEQYRREYTELYERCTKLDVREHRDKIISWIVFWPFNLLWLLLDDIVYAIAREIYYFFGKTLQRMADHVFASSRAKFAAAVAPPPTAVEDDRAASAVR